MKDQPQHSQKLFAETLGELLRRRQESGPLGRINLRAFFSSVDGWEYEYLRKMVMGERPLVSQAMEAMADALGVDPEYFLEYRIWQIQEGFRRHPNVADDVYQMLMASFKLLDARAGLSRNPAEPIRDTGRGKSKRRADPSCE